MSDRADRDRKDSDHPPVAGILPLARVTEHEDGTVAVTLDGSLVISGPIERSQLGRVLSAVAEQHGGPVRVELAALDGRLFADVLHPPQRQSAFAPPLPPSTTMPVAEPLPARSHTASAVRSLLEIDGEGFVPGEDVEVAAIVSSSSAAPDGTARGLVDSAAIGVPLRGLVLIGDVSGTVAVRYLP